MIKIVNGNWTYHFRKEDVLAVSIYNKDDDWRLSFNLRGASGDDWPEIRDKLEILKFLKVMGIKP